MREPYSRHLAALYLERAKADQARREQTAAKTAPTPKTTTKDN
jgi:hypothetical protein